MKILVFSATYNEAGNIKELLTGIRSAVPQADVLIVDDGSRDGTVDAMETLDIENLTIVQRPGKMGLGTAHVFAFCYAGYHGYDVLVTMDADGSHEPSSIPALIERISQGYDFSIGSRYAAGGACDYSGYRLRVSQAANIAARLLLGIRLSEFTTSFRAFRVKKLRFLPFSHLMVGGYSFFLTAVVESARCGMRMSEVPIHFRERGYGVSKIPPFEIFRGMSNLIKLVIAKLFYRQPVVLEQVFYPCNACGTPYSLIHHGGVGHNRVGTCVRCGGIQ